jgi:myo-inositol-hexaphosphate 3-phosphohydrolase
MELHEIHVNKQKWKMEFHPGKCNVLTISKKASLVKYQYNLHGHILESVNNAKYLGLKDAQNK